MPILLLEKRGVQPLPSALKQPIYDISAWPQLWDDMMNLATLKAQQQHDLPLPASDGTIPLMHRHVLKMAKEDGFHTKPKTHAQAEKSNRISQECSTCSFYMWAKDFGFNWIKANMEGTVEELVDAILADPEPALLIDEVARAFARSAAKRVFAVQAEQAQPNHPAAMGNGGIFRQ